ncbi:MAG: SIS domain-containing protein [Clostridia bacterium]|nr:SIS domain-containing protein [Clostridia bacterium]
METIMSKEIYSQSVLLNRTYATNLALAQELAQIIKDRNIRHIVMVARGSSNNACIYFKYLCEIFVGITVTFVHPSVVTVYNGKLNMQDSMVVGVSQSGRAVDVGIVLNVARSQGAITVGITNDLTSPIALNTMYSFYLDVEQEQALPATKSYTAEMLVLYMIVRALMDDNCTIPTNLPELKPMLDKVYNLREDMRAIAQQFATVQDMIVLSRGICLGVGREIALKLQETCFIPAQSFAISDFYHGPIAMLNEKIPVLIVASNDITIADVSSLIDMLKPTGCNITIFTPNTLIANKCDNSIIVPCVDDMLTPIALAVAGQMFALYVSNSKGLNPDSVRRLSKVVITK